MALSYKDISEDIEKLSPMMQQYMGAKLERPDCILFFRLGDFYEMFFDDAVLVSKELELTLTARECGLEEKAPMAGVPHHAVESYLEKLIDRGYKVAICEQVEDPAEAKGIVKREIVRIVTPGTVTDIGSIDESKNNYLMGIYQLGTAYAIANIDLTSGEFEATEILTGDTEAKLFNEIKRIDPAEIVINSKFKSSNVYENLIHEEYYMSVIGDEHFSEDDYEKYIPETARIRDLISRVASALLFYIEDTQKEIPGHINKLEVYETQEFMVIGSTARANLELTQTLRDRKKRGSLLWVLDQTETAMGSRMLRKWLEQPLLDSNLIGLRLDAVEEFYNSFILRQELKEILSGMSDISRLSGKLSMKQLNARELQALARTLAKIPGIVELAKETDSKILQRITNELEPLETMVNVLNQALQDELPIAIQEGGLIKDGFDEVVDENREISENGSNWILNFEKEEKDKYGIKNLKVAYNRVFGYFIEVTKSNLNLVPEHYTRKQTLANAERYIIPELKDMEDKILGAKQRLETREYEVFIELRNMAADHVEIIQKNADLLASLDALLSLAEVAERNNYVRPEIVEESIIDVKDGRHPVVERTLKNSDFIANDTDMDDGSEVILLTGPNMSGKSTYMRQVAQILVLAQMGSFVPASYAKIGITDQIFTRIGASDDLSSGQSTFMVEMNELAYILENASSRSLLILDEIGRGTSTYDGLAIAWAVLERVANKNILGARTLFATHYHELTELEKSIDNIKNYHVTVEKANKSSEIKFLHKIEKGPTDQSYGIEVAKLAKVPSSLVNRAYEILYSLENTGKIKYSKSNNKRTVMDGQIDLFSSSLAMEKNDKIMGKLENLDVQNMTAMEALQVLYNLSEEAKKLNKD